MNLSIGDGKEFDFRVSGIIENNGKVLLKRSEFDSHWTLPGGKCAFTEQSQNTLKREIMSDCEASVDVGSLVLLSESFFNSRSRTYHELGMFFKATLSGESVKLYDVEQFDGVEHIASFVDDYKLHYRWFDEKELEELEVRPSFLKEKLFNLPITLERVINNDLLH